MEDFDEGTPSSQVANNGAQQLDVAQHADVFRSIGGVSRSAAAYQVQDQVHGTLSLHPACELLIHTPHFKRLQRLRQLGVACSVFPSAVHTRLEHSLGVSHLSLEMLQGLRDRQGAQLELEEWDLRNVAIAGLCHDLGHGPLSHAFEKEFMRRSGVKWLHEDMSLKMLGHMVQESGIDCLSDEDIQAIEVLIKGAKSNKQAASASGKRFLFDIVSNDQNGVDMDRADYMQRDSLMCGQIQLGCNFGDLMASARVVDDQICYPVWQAGNVWNVYRERVRLFREVYTHRRTKAAELMAVDALLLADQALHFSADIYEPEDFVTLDDGLLATIEFYHKRHKKAFKLLDEGEKKALDAAQEILQRLTKGDVYDCCGEFEVPERLLLDGTWEKTKSGFTDEIVVQYGRDLVQDDVMLDLNSIDYGKDGVDPMAAVGFYDGDGDSCHRVESDLSQLVGRPECFKIRTLRMFVRSPGKREAAAEAFQRWCHERLGSDMTVDVGMMDERDNRYGSPAAAAAATASALASAARVKELRAGVAAAVAAAAAARRVEEPLSQRKGATAAADSRLNSAGTPPSPMPVTPAAKRSKTELSTRVAGG